ncbi:MAG: N-6 DNA methylase [Thermodesulfovibrionales bacterium]|nr:N-6 DNA methylase [Thermodesulfovibrionales bacterium]
MKKTKLTEKPAKVTSPFDTTSLKTERTCVAKIAEWINRIIEDRALSLGRAEVETRGPDDKYPDIVLYESPEGIDVLLVAEFKRPYFDPYDDTELKEPARKKATKRKAKYFVTSNFQKLIWFNTENVNRMEREEDQIVDEFHLSEIYDLDSIDEPQFKNTIIKNLESFLEELVKVHTGKKPEPLKPIDEHLVFRLHYKVHRLSRFYRPIIRDKVHKDIEFRKNLKKWFIEQQWSFTDSEADYEKVARQTAYLLVNKILFYDVLKSRNPDIPTLTIPEDLTKGGLLKNILEGYFNYILTEIDYQTIYDTDFIDQIAFPDSREIVKEIKDLIDSLSRYRFAEIDFDIIGRIFEMLIPPAERHDLGQYFTSADIVDLILRFCIQNERDTLLDPSSGAGTFLVRAYKHKRLMNQRLSHNEILKDLWGFDIAKFPAHLSTINLALRDLSVRENYPQIIKEDFFAFKHYAEFERKKEIVSPDKKKILISYPTTVDCVVGNPPYTRQEEIKEISKEAGYKEDLIERALYDGSRKIAHISKRAGIHAYFFIHGTKFLKNGGRFGYIVSNSWLDVDYGKGLQEFFLKNYKIIAIIESKVERWFEAADVNTCIVILEKCKDQKARDENLVRFVYLFKPLRHFIPAAQKTWEEERIRFNAIDNLVKTILFHNDFYQTEEYRIYPQKQSELWEEGFDAEEDKYTGSKWGKYLRAPEIFFKILEKGKDKLVPLKEIADVRRGFTTGANEFFYLTEEEIKERGIEKEFWMHKDEKDNWIANKVIVSPREAKSVVIKPESLNKIVLFVDKDKNQLKNKKILSYIRNGERLGFHTRPTCSSRRLWYSLDYRNPWSILHPMIHHDRQTIISNKFGVQVDHNLFEIKAKRKRNNLGILCFLLSTVSMLFKEFSGRVNLGEGALKTEGIDVEKLLIPKEFSKDTLKTLKKLARKYENEPINSIFSELAAKYPDEVSLDKVKPARRELDKIIMGDILGLTKEEQLEVYRAVIDLVRSRIEKAKSFGKKGKIKEGLDVELLTRTIKEKLGDKLLGNFYRENILNQKNLKTVKLFHPDTPLTSPLAKGGKRGVEIKNELFGWRLSSGKDHIDCQSEAEAEYLKIWLESGLEEVKVPKDESYISKILPELKALKEKIDRIISDHISSITSQKLQRKILQKLQGELF